VELTNAPGRVERVNGPVVHIRGLHHPVRLEFVEVGDAHLPGEIIALDEGIAIAQVHEYTGGLSVGAPAWSSGRPMTVELGPGLLGGIYDGLLRPLDIADDFLAPRRLTRPRPSRHRFEPRAEQGDVVSEGDVLGVVPGSFEHLVLVPPGRGGRLDRLVPADEYTTDDTIAEIEGEPVRLLSEWPIRLPRPVLERRAERRPFITGQRVLDVLEPIATGSSATVIGGFGEGKTMLLEQLAKWGDADVIIYVGCGERGNELADLIDELGELIDPRSGHPLVERTIILANTSNMPVMAREASIYTAVTIAEFFRDMGAHAVIIADSTSRWAEARRELSSRTGAIPAEQGYPADLPASLAAFYQRAGSVVTTGGREGAVTIVTSVSPPGGDATEPVSAHTQRFVQAVWALDRDLAYARHYPAVSWHRSFSRDGEAVARWYAGHGDADWSVRRSRLHSLLNEADRLQGIADLVGLSSLPTDERVTLLGARLVSEAVLQQSALSERDAFCSPAKQAALVSAVLDVHDQARSLGRSGVPAAVIEGFDFGSLVRAKDTVDSDDAVAVERIATELLHGLRELAP
jgi:V/A-type H+/Na+-transporting ATPase subunit A